MPWQSLIVLCLFLLPLCVSSLFLFFRFNDGLLLFFVVRRRPNLNADHLVLARGPKIREFWGEEASRRAEGLVGYDFHHIRKKYDAPSMWDNIRPRWRLLQQHLETKGPGWYSLAEREERLFTNRSNRPGDDMKDELRTNSDPSAWSTWRTSQNQLWQLRQPASPLEFPGEQGMLTNMLCPGSRERTSHIAAVHW